MCINHLYCISFHLCAFIHLLSAQAALQPSSRISDCKFSFQAFSAHILLCYPALCSITSFYCLPTAHLGLCTMLIILLNTTQSVRCQLVMNTSHGISLEQFPFTIIQISPFKPLFHYCCLCNQIY